eukprot:GHVR01174586.1.p1 GENE.GHVR01174586.1~~GHVR01174586.1.p1  ORF type:complete len:111 (-),score=17.08 GHVR01174586.1:167-499(-)
MDESCHVWVNHSLIPLYVGKQVLVAARVVSKGLAQVVLESSDGQELIWTPQVMDTVPDSRHIQLLAKVMPDLTLAEETLCTPLSDNLSLSLVNSSINLKHQPALSEVFCV